MVLCPTSATALTAGFASVTAVRNPAMSLHVGFTPIKPLGSRSPGRAGAALNPQFPITMLVQP